MYEHVNPHPDSAKECPAGCNRRGMCVKGRCICVVAWSGADCSIPVPLPCKQEAVPFTGWAFNLFAAEADLDIYGKSPRKDLVYMLGDDPTRQLDAFRDILKNKLLVPPIDPLLRLVGKSCAVVGSSDVLLSCDVGQQIDAHDVVIRLNDAPTEGYERHVGTRTTLRFQGTARALFREGDELTINLSHAYLLSGGGRNLVSYDEISGLNGYYNVHRGHSNLQMSFGWKCIHAAMHLCGQVTLFGFTATNDSSLPTNGFSHYYPKWYDGKAFALYGLWKVGMASEGVKASPSCRKKRPAPGRPRVRCPREDVWHMEPQPNFVARWWTHEKRKMLTQFLNDPASIKAFHSERPSAVMPRMEAPTSLRKVAKYGLTIQDCARPWTNHCIDEEARCTAALPSMVPRVELQCCGVGRGSGLR
eukprot:jgi/Mesvir1/5048/Mv02249-RA.1